MYLLKELNQFSWRSKLLCVKSDGGELDVVTFSELVTVNKYASYNDSGGVFEFECACMFAARLVLKSIGYKSIPLPGLTFNHHQGTTDMTKVALCF